MSNETIEKASKIVREHGIWLSIQNMLLLPGETFETAMETFNLNVRCKPNFSTASKFQPYPGLELTETAIQMGFLKRGQFENELPDNFHWISILKFSNLNDVDKVNNLLNLFTFGVTFPFMKPFIYLLLRIPNNKLHHYIDDMLMDYPEIAQEKDQPQHENGREQERG